MSRFRCYITPFLEDGNYGTEVEVTSDVNLNSFSNISQQIDGNEYDIGTLTFNNLNLKLRNDHGHYSDPSVPESIFRYKRNDSIFRMDWIVENEGCICGIAIAGLTMLSTPIDVYKGFINDESATTDIKSQMVTLKVISLESAITRVEVPFGSFSDGMLVSVAILAVLNQTLITTVITVNAANINVSIDTTIDVVEEFESMTGKEAMDILLSISNSTFYVKDSIAYVVARTATADVKYTFYGAMSNNGLENIQNISNLKSGMSKTFNFITWVEKSFNVQDATSIVRYGIRKKEISETCITDTTRQQAILADLITEFGNPSENFNVSTPVNYDTMALFFLDRVSVDYPTVFIPAEGKVLPIYDVSNYDEAYYPIPESTLTIVATRRFKIMGMDINVGDQIIKFNMREI